jgi:hypothetical protein
MMVTGRYVQMRASLWLIFNLLVSSGVFAQESDDWGDDASEADDVGFALSRPVAAPSYQMGNLSIKGYFKYRFGLWVQRSSVEMPSTSRVSTDLQLRYKNDGLRMVVGGRLDHDSVYMLKTRGYDDATRSAYGNRVFVQEAYLAYAPQHFELSIGRQSVAWGEGDGLSPSDLVTPYDQREFGLADLDDVRRPRLLTRLNWFVQSTRLEFIIAHEAYFGERPTPRSEYSPLRASLATSPQLNALLANKDLNFESQQSGYDVEYWDYFGRWSYTGAGVDLGLTAARLHDRQGVLELPTEQALSQPSIDLPLLHKPYFHLGQTGAAPWGNWLFKWEVALSIDEPTNSGQLDATKPVVEQSRVSRLTPMFGLSFNGVSQLTLSAEFQRPYLLTTLKDPLYPMELSIVALRAVGNYMRERLRLIAVASVFGLSPHLGQFYRAEANYEVRDGFRLGLMYVHYNAQDSETLSPLSGLERHDQVLANCRWDFQY